MRAFRIGRLESQAVCNLQQHTPKEVLDTLWDAVRQRGMQRWLTHECIAKELFSVGYSSATGSWEAWKAECVNKHDDPEVVPWREFELIIFYDPIVSGNFAHRHLRLPQTKYPTDQHYSLICSHAVQRDPNIWGRSSLGFGVQRDPVLTSGSRDSKKFRTGPLERTPQDLKLRFHPCLRDRCVSGGGAFVAGARAPPLPPRTHPCLRDRCVSGGGSVQ